jgi:hypothetical protein
MNETVDLRPISKDENSLHEALKASEMVVLRSETHFLYVLSKDANFYLFSHVPGTPEGSRKSYPDGEEGRALLKNLVGISETAYAVTYDDKMDIRGVMAAAEEGILSMFPIEAGQGGAEVDFGRDPESSSG